MILVHNRRTLSRVRERSEGALLISESDTPVVTMTGPTEPIELGNNNVLPLLPRTSVLLEFKNIRCTFNTFSLNKLRFGKYFTFTTYFCLFCFTAIFMILLSMRQIEQIFAMSVCMSVALLGHRFGINRTVKTRTIVVK